MEFAILPLRGLLVASNAVMMDLTRVRRLWKNELRQRRSRSLSVMTGPESMTGGTSAMYSEVEYSFEKRVPLCEPGKCVGLCIIGYSVQCPAGFVRCPVQYSESLSP